MTEGWKDGMTDKANTKCPLAILWRGHKNFLLTGQTHERRHKCTDGHIDIPITIGHPHSEGP